MFIQRNYKEIILNAKNYVTQAYRYILAKLAFHLNTPAKQVGAVVALIVLWMLSGIFTSHDDKESEAVNNSNNLFKAIKVIGEERDQVLKLTGTTEASKKVEIKAEVEGKITNIYAKQGAELKQGDKIIGIDPKNAREHMEETKATLKQKELLYQSTLKLYNKGLSSEVALNAAMAQMKQAESNYKSALINYKNTTITAPFDGIVDLIKVDEGDYVSSMEHMILADFIAIDPIKVIVNLPEKDIALAKHAKTAIIELDASKRVEDAKVTFLSKISDSMTRTFRMEIEVNNPDHFILSGETVGVILPVKKLIAHKIPQSALVLNMEGSLSVKTLNEKNMVNSKLISIIDEDSDGVWVSGLEATQRVLVLGQAFANEGQLIESLSE